MLEGSMPPEGVVADKSVAGGDDAPEVEPEPTGKGRGVRADRKAPPPARAARKIKGRTIYLADDLFERILVQAHRRDRTISEYVAMILERQVPDHRTVVRAGPGEDPDVSR